VGNAQGIDLNSGQSQYVEIGDKPALDLNSGSYTVELFTKLETDIVEYLIGKRSVGDKGWALYRDSSSDDLIFVVHSDALTYKQVQTTTTCKPDDGCLHIAVTYNSDTQDLMIYRNGVWQATTASALNAMLNNVPVTIGASGAPHAYFNGIIQCVRISDIVRYTENFTPPVYFFKNDANTLGLWYFDGDLTDQSGNEFDGIFQTNGGSETYIEGCIAATGIISPFPSHLNV